MPYPFRPEETWRKNHEPRTHEKFDGNHACPTHDRRRCRRRTSLHRKSPMERINSRRWDAILVRTQHGRANCGVIVEKAHFRESDGFLLCSLANLESTSSTSVDPIPSKPCQNNVKSRSPNGVFVSSILRSEQTPSYKRITQTFCQSQNRRVYPLQGSKHNLCWRVGSRPPLLRFLYSNNSKRI